MNVDRLERGGDYLNYVLIHGTKLGTEANNYIRRLQRSTNGFEALRLMRLRFTTVVGQADFYLAECERDSGELLQLNLCSKSYYWTHCLPSTWFP